MKPDRTIERRTRFSTTITRGGQVTLPAAVRRRLGVELQDQVEFVVCGDRIEVRAPLYTMENVFDDLPDVNLSMSDEQLEEHIADVIVRNVAEEMREG